MNTHAERSQVTPTRDDPHRRQPTDGAGSTMESDQKSPAGTGGTTEQHLPRGPRPRIRIDRLLTATIPSDDDKTLSPDQPGETDQTIGLNSLTPYSATVSGTDFRGAEIRATGQELFSSEDYSDGFRWTQTIETNVPLGGTSSPYVDPRPNDDTKPFYYTDSEHGTQSPNFYDRPRRTIPATGTTRWFATLALNGVKGTTVTAFDTIQYGFEVDSSGSATVLGPASTSVAAHQSILSSEFPGWTFL